MGLSFIALVMFANLTKGEHKLYKLDNYMSEIHLGIHTFVIHQHIKLGFIVLAH